MSFLELHTEKWNYLLSTNKEREYLLPNIPIPLLPINIMQTVTVLTDNDEKLAQQFLNDIESNLGESGGKFGDIKTDNLGWHKGRVVKIDYGFPYVYHNVWIDVKNMIKSGF